MTQRARSCLAEARICSCLARTSRRGRGDRVRAAGETQWHLHQAGRYIGSIVERGGAFQASRIVEGELRGQRFADRDAAAMWLLKLAGG